MKRILVILGTVAATLGLSAVPANAEISYTPSEADFADCPAKPANATKWTCYVHTLIEGGFTIGSRKYVRVLVDKTLRMTAAEGETADGTKLAAWGGLRQPQSFKVATVVPGTTVILSVLPEVEAKVVGLGLNKPNSIDEFKGRIQLTNPGGGLLGPNCTIGTDANPVVFKPKATITLPWLFGFTPMARTWAEEKTFVLPASTNCGTIPLVMPNGPDAFLGLPAASGDNSADLVWAIRHKTF